MRLPNHLSMPAATAGMLLLAAALAPLPATAQSGDDLPQNAILFFRLGACPSGWVPVTDAAGRLLVPSPPSAGGVKVGRALSNSDQDMTHSHPISLTFRPDGTSFAAASGGTNRGKRETYSIGGTSAATSANLPYIQLLVCRKTAAPAGSPPALPKGLLMFYQGTACPAGFSEPADQRGRLQVAVPRFGALGKTFGGPPLQPGESRSHTHPQQVTIELPGKKVAIASGCCRDGFAKRGTYRLEGAAAGTTAGATSVGYIQFLQCEKD